MNLTPKRLWKRCCEGLDFKVWLQIPASEATAVIKTRILKGRGLR